MEKTVGVKSFVGIDAHSKNCSIKAMDAQGEKLIKAEVSTQAGRLRQALVGLPKPAWVLLEASTMAPFVKDSIESCVDRVIVCETRENRWIAKSEDKGDPADADRLARLLRMGEFKEVHVPHGLSRDRREFLRLYIKLTGDATRTMNRIKIKYREHGISVEGKSLYSPQHRDKWLGQIKRREIRSLLSILYQKLDADQAAADAAFKRLMNLMQATSDHKRLKTIPGIGDVFGTIIVSIIDDPFRFADKRKLWSYAGLGTRRRWSSDPSKVRVSGSSSGNRILKYAALGAAKASLKGKNRFSRHYKNMLSKGIDTPMAQRTIARQILATALSMLKSGRAYEDDGDIYCGVIVGS